MVQTQTPYRVVGKWLESCNCDPGCNCNFGGFPDHGPCEAIVGVYVDDGKFGDLDLTGMKAVLAIKWPKAIHEGNGSAAVFVDESASSDQVTALATILTGQAGGMPWEFLATTLTSLDGPNLVPIKMNVDGRNSGFSIDGVLEVTMTPLKNPVTGDDNEVHIVFPNGGAIFNDGDTATTSIMKIDHKDLKFNHTGKNGIFAPVDWSNQ